MNTRHIGALLAALMVIGLAGEAFALDGYRDRRGMFYGLALGGGSAQSDGEHNDDRELGVHLRARIGGGVNKHVTLDGELGWRYQSVEAAQYKGPLKVAELDIADTTLTMYVGGNFFVFDGLYIRAMGGLAHLIRSFDAETDFGDDYDDDSYTGLGVGAGVGYEFFASSDLAIGIGGDFQQQFYDEETVTLINFGVSASWY